MILGEKQSLRVKARHLLTGIDIVLRQAASRRIRDHLEGWEPWRTAHTVCAFSALPCEPDILTPWPATKKMSLPRVIGTTLNLHTIEHAGQLVAGSFGISEPPRHAPVAEAKADLILVDDCGVMLPPSRTGSKSPAPSAFWISAPSGS